MKNETSWGYTLPTNTTYKRRYRSHPRDRPDNIDWWKVAIVVIAFVLVMHIAGG